MARTLTAAMQTAIAADEGYADIWLLELNSSGGTLRYCDKPWDATWNAQTWQGIGGIMQFAPPPEQTDLSGQSMRLTISGVTQSVIATILTDDMRGRAAVLHWGQIDLSVGTVIVDPIEVFNGLLNDDWQISHAQPSGDEPGTVTVQTTVTSRLARGLHPRQVRTNVTSHDAMLDRAGETVGDRLFEFVPTIASRQVIWGGQRAVGVLGPDQRGGPGDNNNGDDSGVIW